ncbi:hypothetical protein HPC38_00625 [Pasteurellaceae bacterium HPA106]|uniref:hypothetical protein n=1 Tax=Spirabiliibacterium pneumoniae TaxID=221400 RepID=UPI001AACABDE|nr:hypothetical protein [Spirabiliibacterium pneumoniae]MBE2895386.1 hypothetical protein [Spirabiliibacterium pneumoniae]
MDNIIWVIALAVLVLLGFWFIGNVLRNRREKARLDQHEQSVVVLSSHQSGFADRVDVLSYNGINVSPFSFQGEQAIYLPVGQVRLVVQAQSDEVSEPHQMNVNVAKKAVYHLRYNLNTEQYQFILYTEK